MPRQLPGNSQATPKGQGTPRQPSIGALILLGVHALLFSLLRLVGGKARGRPPAMLRAW
jgi:hypothetical protein